jgi:lipoprotein-releasing system permease protein
MLRSHPDGYTGGYHDYQTTVNQGSYLCSFDAENPRMARALQAPDPKDIDNLLAQADYGNAQALETEPESLSSATPQSFRDSVGAILSHYEISSLQVAEGGWTLPRSLLPTEGSLRVLCLLHGPGVRRVVLPTEQSSLPRLGQELKSEGYALKPAELLLGAAPQLRFADGTSQPLLLNTPLILEAGTVLRAQFESESLARARHRDELRFNVETEAQGLRLAGSTALSSLRIHTVIGQEKSDADAQWALRYTLDDRDRARLPVEEEWGAPILVARGYRKNGMALGDRGYLSYFAPTATSVQEQRLPIYVAGFFDPGVMPMGGKLIFASKDFVSLVRSSYDGDQGSVSNGINVWMDDLGEAEQVRSALQSRFDQLGISPYWKIETYREFDFTRDLIRQLQSERNVFTLIAIIIIIVACSNIISMLVILVNDKRQEIGILRSMGASAGNIASIFGVCGLSMGLVGGVLGTGAAMLTLHYLHPLIDLISFVQGYDAFNSMFYGDTLPNDLSYRALSFVFVTTLVISLLAGIIPAIKAARMRPSAILRSE